MRFIFLLLFPLTLLLTSCGPSDEELRTELRAIDGELMAIRIAVNRYRSQMNQAEIEAFFGSFAAGYGATSGDYGLALDGVGTTSSAMQQYDVSSYSLNQLQTRHLELMKRRFQIQKELK